MKKYLFVLLALLAFCSCSKEWGDDHVPSSYHDGVFSFDYNGDRYHQYNGGYSSGGFQGCSAYAMYHSCSDMQKDTLIIVGGVNNHIRIAFRIPFERIINTNGVVEVFSEDFYVWTNRITERAAVIRFDHFFKGDEYIDGTFSASFKDERGGQFVFSGGLFKFRPMPYSPDFQRDGNSWALFLSMYSN